MRRAGIYIAVALCVLAVGYARWELLRYWEDKSSLVGFADRAAVVAGRVSGDPDRRATSLRVPITVEAINGQSAFGHLLAVLPRETSLEYGDRVEVRGLIELPQAFETDTGRVFDYPGYLRVRGLSVVMQRAVLREHTPEFALLQPLYRLKHAFEHALESVLPEPEVSLLEGMLLGERGGLPSALLQAFIIVGLVHIVVLSGSNIAIVAEGMFRLLGAVPRLPRKYIFILGFAAIVLFALMTGGGAATVRAVIMGSIAIVARYLRRPEAALRALIIAAVAMVLWNPLVLWLDHGFILSVLATFGLITLSPYIETKLTRLPAWGHFNIRSIVATTLAVEIFILPALLYTSGILSFVSLPANVLVLPLLPIVMLLGFVAGLSALVHPLLGLIPALLAQVVLKVIILVAQGAAALPFASATVIPFPGWVVALVYVPITWLALRIYSRKPTN
ncbi:MAG TPA: ComEC/Rec2 family competence protein [Candidatus Paceibacterota bacterium]